MSIPMKHDLSSNSLGFEIHIPPNTASHSLQTSFTETSEDIDASDAIVETAQSDVDNDSVTGADGKEEESSKEQVFQRAQGNGVSLEEMERTQDGTALVGTVVVRNECYKKDVFVHHTSNAWQTYEDTLAKWMETLEGGTLDRFSFLVPLPEGSYSIEFALSFNEKWDNNNGQNYSVTCTAFHF